MICHKPKPGHQSALDRPIACASLSTGNNSNINVPRARHLVSEVLDARHVRPKSIYVVEIAKKGASRSKRGDIVTFARDLSAITSRCHVSPW